MTPAHLDMDKCMTIHLDYELPEYPAFEEGYRRAPRRESHLTEADKILAIKNALRYIHPDHHEQMAKEFAQELEEHGRIYGYRFRPEGKLYGKPIDEYKGNCIEGKAFQVMIDNNLDFDVALYPYELVTYGETGQVCQNWMQYRLIKKYLEIMTDEQTLVVMSGHPLGLFHSHKSGSPLSLSANGLMVGMYDDQKNFNRAAAIGCCQLRPDDRRRLDVHRPPGHRPRHLQHAAKRRPHQFLGIPRRRRPGRPSVRLQPVWAA